LADMLYKVLFQTTNSKL